MATGYQNPVTIGKGQSNLQDFLSDEALFLDFSIFLTSREGAEEIIQDVVDVARAYGFTDIPAVWSATSSFYGNIRAKFKSKDPEAALLSKKELQKDLLGKKQPKSLKKKKAVHKLRGSMLKRAKKRLGTIVVAGAVFLGSFAGEVAKDMAKDEVKAVITEQAPKAAQKADGLATKELSPEAAARFHNAIGGFIQRAPDKSTSPPPPEK